MATKQGILLTGVSIANKNSEAMLCCAYQQLSARTGLTNFSVLSSTAPSEVELLLSLGVQPWKFSRTCKAVLRLASRTRLLGRITGRLIARRLLPAHTGAVPCAVVDVSGYHYRDFAMTLSLRMRYLLFGEPTELFNLFGALDIPMIYLPRAWGPFRTPHACRLTNRLLETAALVYARDQESYQWLQGLPAFCKSKVRLGSDVAFLFQWASPEIGHALLSDLGARLDLAPVVGIVPNMRVYHKYAQIGHENLYVRRLSEVAQYFIRELGCQVVVMPHELQPGVTQAPFRDDRYLCQCIAEAVPEPNRIYPALSAYTASQLKAMIGLCDLLINSRYHSIVAALSLRRPVVCISWTHKYADLLGSVGLADFVVSHKHLGTSDLIGLCHQAWAKRSELAAQIDRHVHTHEASARAVMEEVAGVITSVCQDW